MGGLGPLRPQALIRWPERYRPEATAVHVRQEIDMPVSPEEAWPWLVRASKWPEWYPDIRSVRIQDGQSELRLGSRFHWKFSMVSLDSIVEEFVPFERLAWTVRSTGIDAYHAWLIERLPPGCLIASEETQNGWVARLNEAIRPGSTERIHHEWLRRLREKAGGGLPG